MRGYVAVAARKSAPVKSAVKSSGKKRSTLFLSELPIIVGYFHALVMGARTLVWARRNSEQ